MYLVSACLTGVNCRYDGGNTANAFVQELVKKGEAIAICPEQLAGLSTPRVPCEIIIGDKGNKRVMTKEGQDITNEFLESARKTLNICKVIGIEKAILQSQSPSCGYGFIYDGTFSGNLIKGNGFTSELLAENNIKIYNEKELDSLV